MGSDVIKIFIFSNASVNGLSIVLIVAPFFNFIVIGFTIFAKFGMNFR